MLFVKVWEHLQVPCSSSDAKPEEGCGSKTGTGDGKGRPR